MRQIVCMNGQSTRTLLASLSIAGTKSYVDYEAAWTCEAVHTEGMLRLVCCCSLQAQGKIRCRRRLKRCFHAVRGREAGVKNFNKQEA